MKGRSVFLAVLVTALAIAIHLAVRTPPVLSERVLEWHDKGRYALVPASVLGADATVRIFYRDDLGTGPADRVLVCLHGFPTSSYDWAPVWDKLLSEFGRVIAIDMLGFGFSDKSPSHEFSLMDQSTIHEWLISNVWHVSDLHILAHDYGVTVAQELLARFQERKAPLCTIKSIVFLNGGLFPGQHQPRVVQKLLALPYAGPVVSFLMTKTSFSVSFSEVFGPDSKPTPDELEDFWAIVCHGFGNRIYHKLIRYMSERVKHKERWVGALTVSPSTVPMLFINGPADPVSGEHMARVYLEKVPNPECNILDAKIGHYPQVEDPVNVVKHMFRFLRKHFP